MGVAGRGYRREKFREESGELVFEADRKKE